MGNTSSRKESDNVYTNEELRFLETAYRNASGGALEKLTSDRLVVGERYWVVALLWIFSQQINVWQPAAPVTSSRFAATVSCDSIADIYCMCVSAWKPIAYVGVINNNLH